MRDRQTKASCRARCIRMAFFISLSEASHPILDGIFDYCFSFWGGRFSLIVPCVGGSPLPEFRPWLKAFDPDVIYSFVDLSEATQYDLHESLYPSVLEHHWPGIDNEHPNYHPRPSVSPLTVATLLPVASAPDVFDTTRGVCLVSAMGIMEKDPFLSGSFGIPSPRLRAATQSDLADSGSMLYAIADNDCQPRGRYLRSSETSVPDVNIILYKMAEDKRVRSLSQLSALRTPRLDLRSTRWGDAFNIVVGDSIHDRVLYWNARSLMPPWRDGSDVDLYIPRSKFDDAGFLPALGEYLRKRNHVTTDSGRSPYRGTLRSISLSGDELALLKDRLKDSQGWLAVNHEHVNSVAECVPETNRLENPRLVASPSGLGSPDLPWQEGSVGRGVPQSVTPKPEHLRHISTSLMNPALGAWAIDFDIERHVDYSPYENVVHRWCLPRRLRTTGAFADRYRLPDPDCSLAIPRISAGGLLTLYTTAESPLPQISLPTDHDAIVTALQKGRDWEPFERYRRTLPQLCAKVSRSNSGRYFWGVSQLFGDLNTARSVLLHAFWRKQLEAYGATDQRTDNRNDRMQKKLIQRIGGRPINLADEKQRRTLADIVLRESDDLRIAVRALTWKQFEDTFNELAELHDKAHPPLRKRDEEEEQRSRLESLQHVVQTLCALGILHQGYEHKCRKCLHRSWISITDLDVAIRCEVCRDTQPAPVNTHWQFRVNGFLREGLRLHGIGPLFWVLSRYQRENRHSFWFEGPLNVFFDKSAASADQPDTDIDLTMIDNGIVRMCEVKQSERQLKDPVGLAHTMKKLRPDIAMIAVMESSTPAIERKFQEFAEALQGTGIKAETLTLDMDRDIETSPYFYL